MKTNKDCCEVCHLADPSNQTVVFTASVRGERRQIPLRLCLTHSLAYERLIHRRVAEALSGPLLVVRDAEGEAHIFRQGQLS